MTNFVKISSSKATDITPVSKYRSEATGITVVIAEVEGPIVEAYICLVTEAHDNDGLPHTLEHLVFLGSEDYPYKGLLDLLANRCLASGTNAWTDVDHTAYTVMTAGCEGSLAILPVYLDHILYPQLTDHGFKTEVYHITGEGTDAGVVYSEMQGRENTADSRSHFTLCQTVYRGCGYASETGGILENLRTSTTNAKVRDYHKKFYRPDNLTLIIAGQVTPEEVFRTIQPIEDKIISKGQLPPFERPWQTPVSPLTTKEIIEISYPTDTEDCGMVTIGWRGPSINAEKGIYNFTGTAILLRYLCDSPIAPLQKALVESDNPIASDVAFQLSENSEPLLSIVMSSVPYPSLKMIVPEVMGCLKKINDGEERLDIDRIRRLVALQLQETLSGLEKQPHSSIAFMCISDMLFSKDDQQFEDRLNIQRVLRQLIKEDEDYWKKLLAKYFGDVYIAVIGYPSIKLMEDMTKEDEERKKNRLQTLGKEGLEQKAKELADAMEYNGREVPSSVLQSINIASCSNFRHHAMHTWVSGGDSCPHLCLEDMPFYSRIHSLHSHFVYIFLTMDTSNLLPRQRQWLPLLTEVLQQSPVMRNGVEVPHSQLLEDLEKLTVEMDLRIGAKRGSRFSPGEFSQNVTLMSQFDPDKYEEVVKLIWEILNSTILTKERLLIVAQKMIKDVTEVRRSGSRIVKDLLSDMNFAKDTNVHLCSLLRQQRFLQELVTGMETEAGAAALIAEGDAVRNTLVAPSNMWLNMAANLEKPTITASPWKIFKLEGDSPTIIKPGVIVPDCDLLKSVEERQGGGCVVGLGGMDSFYVLQTCPGPLGHNHPDLPALHVVLQYFTQLEGPMWRLIRGAGLAYGYKIVPRPDSGMLVFQLYKATNAPAAYTQAINIIKSFLGSQKWDENLFASAKSSFIFEIVEQESTPSQLIGQSFISYFENVDKDYYRNLIKSVDAVTKEEAMEVAARWLPGLYNPKVTKLSIVCNPSKVAEIKADFSKLGQEVCTSNTLEESCLNSD